MPGKKSSKGSGTGKGSDKGKRPSTHHAQRHSEPESGSSDEDDVSITSIVPASGHYNPISAPPASLAITGNTANQPPAVPSTSGFRSLKASVNLTPLFGPRYVPHYGPFDFIFIQKGPNRHRIYSTHPSPHCEICRLRLSYHTHRCNAAKLLHTRLTHINCRHATPHLCHRLADRVLRRETRHLEAKLIAFLDVHSALHPGCVTITDKPF